MIQPATFGALFMAEQTLEQGGNGNINQCIIHQSDKWSWTSDLMEGQSSRSEPSF